MAKKIYENKKELEKAIDSKEKMANKREREMVEGLELIEKKKAEVEGLYNKKDEMLDEIHRLIEEGKKHKKKRDELQSGLSPKWKTVNAIQKEMDALASEISDYKKKRNKHNEKAKGRTADLDKQINDQFRTLMTVETSLKEEIFLFNMVFEMRERIEMAGKADEFHRRTEETYGELKEKEKAKNRLLEEIEGKKKEAEKHHYASIGSFKNKDKLSKELDGCFKRIRRLKQEINDLYLKIQAGEIAKDRLDKQSRYLKHRKKRSIGDKVKLSRREKLHLAKDKMKNEEKMGLEELKLLLKSGEIKKKKK